MFGFAYLFGHFVEPGKFFGYPLGSQVHVPLKGFIGRVAGQLHYKLSAHALAQIQGYEGAAGGVHGQALVLRGRGYVGNAAPVTDYFNGRINAGQLAQLFQEAV